MKIVVSILPVMIFLLILIYYDSYKLVKIRNVLLLIACGCIAAVLSYFINSALIDNSSLSLHFYTRYIAPIIEETAKSAFIFYLIRKNKVGFMIDALIYGFAVGAGFSVLENVYYLYAVESSSIFLWIIRGFGTAVMHGGTTSIFALFSKSLINRTEDMKARSIIRFLPGLLAAIIIHSFFNHLLLPAIAITVLQLIILPILITLMFKKSEAMLKDWMEKGLDNEVNILDQIDNGIFSESHAGKYLLSLSNSFSGPILADMLCMIKIHVELSIKAKGVILFRKAGLPVIIDNDVKDKFEELRYLEKSIGATGKLAVSPILSQSTQDLWQLYMIGFKS